MWLKTNIRTLKDLEYWVEEDEDIFFREAHVELDELFEHLPKVENNYYNYKYKSWRKLINWDLASRILNNNVGKSYNLAYSYYCSRADKRDYDDFKYCWDTNFEMYYYWNQFTWKFEIVSQYIVDENSLIQKNFNRVKYYKSYLKQVAPKIYYENLSKDRKKKREQKLKLQSIDYTSILKQRKHDLYTTSTIITEI